jgi:hypothetical protein
VDAEPALSSYADGIGELAGDCGKVHISKEEVSNSELLSNQSNGCRVDDYLTREGLEHEP